MTEQKLCVKEKCFLVFVGLAVLAVSIIVAGYFINNKKKPGRRQKIDVTPAVNVHALKPVKKNIRSRAWPYLFYIPGNIRYPCLFKFRKSGNIYILSGNKRFYCRWNWWIIIRINLEWTPVSKKCRSSWRFTFKYIRQGIIIRVNNHFKSSVLKHAWHLEYSPAML